MPYLIAFCFAMCCVYVVEKLCNRDMSTYRTDDDAGATRDLIVACLFFAAILAPFAGLWWFAMSFALGARH